MKRSLASLRRLLLVCAFVLLPHVPATASEATPPKSVRDYFMLLPQAYFEIPLAQRKAWLAHPGNIVDVKNGYIKFQGDGAQAEIDVALFTYHGQVTVAMYYTAVNGSLDFFRYVHGRMKTVTKEVMPIPFDGDNVYVLPRYGTTIKVIANKFNEETLGRASKMGKRAYDLVWNQGKFVVGRYK